MDAPDCLVGRYDGYTTAGSAVMHTFTVIISRGTVCSSCLVSSRFSRPRSSRPAVDTYSLVHEVHSPKYALAFSFSCRNSLLSQIEILDLNGLFI